jgi:hypothetical protein
MITNWVKEWNDGRRESDYHYPGDLDYSQVDFDVVLEKQVRSVVDNAIALDELRIFDPYDTSIDYKAFDVMSVRDGEEDFLYIVYASPNTFADPNSNQYDWELWFAKYNLTKIGLVHKTKVTTWTTEYQTVQVNRKASINRYPSGRLWIAFQHGDMSGTTPVSKIASTVSEDDGVTWQTPQTILTDNKTVLFYDDIWDAQYTANNLKVKYNGSWSGINTAVAYDKAIGGSMARSSKKGSYFQFTFKGTHLFLYTYVSSAHTAKGAEFVGSFTYRIAGGKPKNVRLHSRKVNPNAFGGYRYKIPLASNLKSGLHTIRITHTDGAYFFIDGFEVWDNARINYFLDDAIIRSGAVDDREAVAAVGVYDPASKKRNLMFMVDKTGNASGWGTCERHFYRSETDKTKWYKADEDWNCTLYENYRGLFMQVQLQQNNDNVLQTFHWAGPNEDELYMPLMQRETTFDSTRWSVLHKKKLPGGGSASGMKKSKAIRYSVSTAPVGGLCVTQISLRGTTRSSPSTERLYGLIGITGDISLPSADFELRGEYSPVMAFNLPYADKWENTCAIFGCNANGNAGVYLIKNETSRVMLEDITEFVDSVSISHDNSSDASTCSLSLSNLDNLIASRNELGMFYQLLPTNYYDRDTRLVKVYGKYKHGDLSYKSLIFTGFLGQVDEAYTQDSRTLNLNCYDFSKWLMLYNNPYILVYANAELQWMECANDYAVELVDGEVQPASPRAYRTYKVTNPDTQEESNIYEGWFFGKGASKNKESFQVLTEEKCIEQTKYGYLMSPRFKNEDHYIGASFVVKEFPDSTEVDTRHFIRVGFQTNKFDNTVNQPAAHSGNLVDGGAVIFDLYNSEVLLSFVDYHKSDGKSYSSTYIQEPFFVRLDVEYKVEIKCVGNSIKLKIKDSSGNVWDYDNVPRVNSAEKAMCVHIGGGSDTAVVHWDNIFLRKGGTVRPLKSDYRVAREIVGLAFQGIIPLIESASPKEDYFTATVMNPGEAISDTLTRLAAQAGKRWFFDYDGSFRWEDTSTTEPIFTLSDADLNSITMTYDSSNYTNWVEVLCAGGDESSTPEFSDVALTRISEADPTSIMRHGIRYLAVDVGSLDTRERADKIALANFYGKNESMEGLSITLDRPMFFLQPNDEVIVDSECIFPVGKDSLSKYEKSFCISSVNIEFSENSVSMSMEMVSRQRARLYNVAQLYGDGGYSSS